MDSEDDFLFALLGFTVVLSVVAFKKRRKMRRYWVNPYLRTRKQTGRYFTAVSFGVIQTIPLQHTFQYMTANS